MQWYDVSKELPTKCGRYLVTLQFGTKNPPIVDSCMFIPNYNTHPDDRNDVIQETHGLETLKDGDNVWYDRGHYLDINGCVPDVIFTNFVIAWAYLPEPYKKEV